MHVLICGGGVIGASIAYFLSCRGLKPTLSGHSLALLDDLVGAGEDRWRHGETERVRGLQIDD